MISEPLGIRKHGSYTYTCNMRLSTNIAFNYFILQSVYAIREAAAKNLKKLVEKFGAEWAQVRSVI